VFLHCGDVSALFVLLALASDHAMQTVSMPYSACMGVPCSGSLLCIALLQKTEATMSSTVYRGLLAALTSQSVTGVLLCCLSCGGDMIPQHLLVHVSHQPCQKHSHMYAHAETAAAAGTSTSNHLVWCCSSSAPLVA